MSEPTLRIATRQSRLALWQAEHVATLLRTKHPGLTVELVPMTTQGDRILDRPLADIGGKGLFIKELELAMAEQRADIAVHSMKDVPSEMPPGFALVAMLTRADPRDAFVSSRFKSFNDLPQGARVGTSSLRRQCQLKHARPDLELITLRGNVDTRLRKLDEGHYDAIILAAAGLIRLGLQSRIAEYFTPDRSVPAVGQGIIGIECRSDDARNIEYVHALNDTQAWQCCLAERAFAQRLEGSCQSPIAGFATLNGTQLQLHGVIGAPDGSEMYRGSQLGTIADAEQIGVRLAEALLKDGAEQLLERLRQEPK
ncbi:hydroxymethylbilane synthase [Steroidobacter sp.]|uniref:hydroxymethylbilane synthase n=1 Tax=Steroidobacter sp. TaxID=1978227 RepID=UPI001A4CC974|nr:hydroxymethylbilane synthase [Steroidobacter sp.]MBL8264943.1 hydroxymethylbilane synthase [Steroidobacter sp.]